MIRELSQKNMVLIGANYYAPYRGFLNASLGVYRETFRLIDTLPSRRSANHTDVIQKQRPSTALASWTSFDYKSGIRVNTISQNAMKTVAFIGGLIQP